MEEQKTKGKSAYSKRPLWQWVALYIVIGGIIYVAIYFAFMHKGNNPYSYSTSNQAEPVSQVQTENGVYKMMSKAELGTIMTDPKGMTVYTFAKDTTGVSNCVEGCLQAWPAYTVPSQAGNSPENISVIKRPDGTLQYAWKGMPLYFYSKDTDSGDAYGDGVGGVWSVVR